MRRSLVEAKRIPNITPIVKPINNRKEVAPLFGNIKYSTFVRKDKTKKKKKKNQPFEYHKLHDKIVIKERGALSSALIREDEEE